MDYEYILEEIEKNDIEIFEDYMPGNLKALYIEKNIILKKDLEQLDKKCILAEELAHHYFNVGDITDQNILNNRKLEKKARNWAYEQLIPLEKLMEAIENFDSHAYEIAEYLEVTEEFLIAAINHYKEKFGGNICMKQMK